MRHFLQKVSLCLLMPGMGFLHAQNHRLDSLQTVVLTLQDDSNKVNTLFEIGSIYFRNGENEKALQYAKDFLGLSEKINFKNGILKALLGMGNCYQTMGNYPEALDNFSKGLKISEATGDQPNIAVFNLYLSYSYVASGNYPEALKHSFAALTVYKSLGDKHGISEIYNLIGGIYSILGNMDDASKNYLASIKVNEELGYKSGLGQSYNSLGKVYLNQGNYEAALKYTFTGLKLFEELGDKGPDWGLHFTYQCLGDIYQKQGDVAYERNDKKSMEASYKKALDNYLKSRKLARNINRQDGVAELNISLGDVYRKQNSFAKARQHLENGLQQSIGLGLITSIKNGHLSLSMLDSIQGNWQEAYTHYKIYVLFRDSLLSGESTRKITMYKMQYEFDEKEALAKAEQEKQAILEQHNKNVQYFIMLSLLLLVLVSGLIALLLYRNNRQKQKANNLLHRQKTEIDTQRDKAEKALSELKSTQAQLIQSEKLASLGELTAGIAHEIQNPLNFVNNFSELSVDLAEELKLEMEKLEIPEQDREYVGEILTDLSSNQQKINHHGKRAAAIVTGMLQHARTSIGKKEPTDLNALADEYLRLAYHGLRAKNPDFEAAMVTDFDPTIGKVEVIPQDIGRVLLNLINNAFYAVQQRKKEIEKLEIGKLEIPYEPTVTVSTQKMNNQTIMKVKDNGTGIPEVVKAKIFQPFFTTKPTGQGTGLGLSLAYDIVVKGHGGALEVETAEGEGTEFVIQLPSKTILH